MKKGPQAFTPKQRTFWMHTVDGKPAAYDGQQICYWWRRAPLARSLQQIRRERQACIEWRALHGFSVGSGYGHITVRLP